MFQKFTKNLMVNVGQVDYAKLARFAIFASLVIVLSSHPTFAQATTTGSDNIGEVFDKGFKYFEDNVRLPLALIGGIFAAYLWLTDEVNGGRRALGVLGAIVFIFNIRTIVNGLFSFKVS